MTYCDYCVEDKEDTLKVHFRYSSTPVHKQNICFECADKEFRIPIERSKYIQVFREFISKHGLSIHNGPDWTIEDKKAYIQELKKRGIPLYEHGYGVMLYKTGTRWNGYKEIYLKDILEEIQ